MRPARAVRSAPADLTRAKDSPRGKGARKHIAGIVGVYHRHSFADEKRAALEAWGNFVAALVGSEPVSKSSVCASSRE